MERLLQKTSYDVIPDLNDDINVYCAKNKITRTQIINTVFMALLSGDIRMVHTDQSYAHKLNKVDQTPLSLRQQLKLDIVDKQDTVVNPNL